MGNKEEFSLWWCHLSYHNESSLAYRYSIYEHALQKLPGSYKLWYSYLKEMRKSLSSHKVKHPAITTMNNLYERALAHVPNMPKIWIEYLHFLIDQGLITKTRRSFDRSLRVLPITQHELIWPLYLKFIRQPGIPKDTALRVYERYLKLMPNQAEEYVAYLKSVGRWGEAARQISEIVETTNFRSTRGKTNYQLWLEMCDIITKYPEEIKQLQVEDLIRLGIRKFTNEVGRLWISIADYYIRKGMFERSRDIYEEGMTSVATVRDFSLIFDAYAQFEESFLNAKISAKKNLDKTNEVKSDIDDINLRLARLEFLLERRPELVSSVILKQNPHSVSEWHKRVQIFDGHILKQIEVYSEAIRNVDPCKASGKPHTLWCAFAKLYARNKDLKNARIIYKKATNQPYLWLDDLSQVYCDWVEMELRHQEINNALDILRHVLRLSEAIPSHSEIKADDSEIPVQNRIFKSCKLWNLLCDLEECVGSLESTRAIYCRMLAIGVCTPQTILNFASLLIEKNNFEEAFQIYERGVNLFRFPHSKSIWIAYLNKFISKYNGSKTERARDIFEKAVNAAPPEEKMTFYLQYAEFEETFGTIMRAMNVYEKASTSVTSHQRLHLYEIYIEKAEKKLSLNKVREVYEKAIEMKGPYRLSNEDTKKLSLQYANFELKLGEIDRVRGIFNYASQLASPKKSEKFWEEWAKFEFEYGNEETFREMLFVKRVCFEVFSKQ